MDGGGRCRRRTAVSLPEDIVLEILVRVEDEATLFRCAVACRAWRCLVADGSFLRHRWPDQDTSACTRTPSAFVAGFFVRKRLLNRLYSTETFFVPMPRSVLGPSRRLLGSFFPEDASLLDHVDVVPLTTRRGLLLIRLAPRGNHPDSVLRLAVCNMLTGVCDVLPPLECDWNFERSGYAILTGADYSSNGEQQHSAFFKVLIIDNDNIRGPLNLHTFSSQEARWSPPTKCPSDTMTNEVDRMLLSRPEAIVCNGMVHWLVTCKSRESIDLNMCTLDVDTETCYASLTRIEIPKKYLFSRDSCDLLKLGITTGRRLYVFIQQNQGMRVVIWTRQNDGNGEGGSKWVHNRVVELKPPAGAEVTCLVNLNEKGGKLLADGKQSNVYIVDLETRAMEKVAEWSDGWHSRQKGVLLEMDWAAFFASRLGSP